jgi:hypothetical protein
MPAPPPAAARSLRQFWPVAVPVGIALAYAVGHLGWYLGTPLGRVPVLDERENLALAEAIAHGTLRAEPFYRAAGYPLVLAVFRTLGVTANGLFAVALALGALLHAVNAGLVALLARRWFGPAAALAAGLLAALHPVFVHYATQALDATPALTLFLAGLVLIAPTLGAAPADPPSFRRWIGASLCWAAATLMRPNYLLVWATLPVLAAWGWRTPLGRRLLLAATSGAGLFLVAALWQWQVSGTAGFLPWQGGYNLWAANQPGAHGRYYVQHLSLTPDQAQENPARAESVLLYQQETGRTTDEIGAMNAHWRARFLDYVWHHPVAWVGQLARKAYALLNDWEQYNNKTFAFHQARSPWLRWNPLGWGLLFVLGTAGAARLAVVSPRTVRPLALIAGAVAVSILLFFVSARFRLPLTALATALAGGAIAGPGFWRSWPAARQGALLGLLVVAGLLTFSTFDHVRDRTTFVQDHALLARAAASTGDDALAWHEALAALDLQPAHPDARRLAVASHFNLLLAGNARPADELRWRAACADLLNDSRTDAPDLRAVAALAIWRAGQPDTARAIWRQLGPTPSALAARLLVRDATATPADLAALPPAAWDQPLVRLAAVQLAIPPPAGVGLDSPAQVAGQVLRILTVTPTP